MCISQILQRYYTILRFVVLTFTANCSIILFASLTYLLGESFMFWTNLIKGVCKIFLVLSIIGSVIGGIAFADMADNVLIGIGLIIIGVVISFLSISGIMMICEISENVYEIKYKMSNNPEHISYQQPSVSPVRSIQEPNNEKKKNITSKKAVEDTSAKNVSDWVCSCGTRNYNIYCKKCGKKRPDSFVPKQGSWECPECGMNNPNSSRVCKDCGYQK